MRAALTGGTNSLTDGDGSLAAYGPAVIFGWYSTGTGTGTNTGTQTAFASGSIAGSGSVMSRATIAKAGPGPLVMPQIITACSQSGSSVSRTVQISNRLVQTSTDPTAGAVTSTQAIPSNPAPGTRGSCRGPSQPTSSSPVPALRCRTNTRMSSEGRRAGRMPEAEQSP